MRPAIVLERQAALAIRVLLIGALLAAALFAFRILQPIVLPLFFALLITALLTPLVRRLERVGARRGVAVSIVMLGFVVLIFGTFAFVIPALLDQVTQATTQVQEGLTKIPDLAKDLGLDAKQTQELIATASDRLRDNIGSVGTAISSSALTIASATVAVLFGAFLTFVLLVYLLMDGDSFWKGGLRLIDAHRRERTDRSAIRAWHALQIFVRSQVLVAAFDAIGIVLGLIALGIPLVLPLGVLTFVLSFVPYLGATLSGLIVALVALSTVGPGAMVGILAIAIIVQALEGNIFYPIFVGRNLRLHPITVLLAVGVGTSVLGVLGAFFATPVLATVAAAAGLLPDTIDGEEEPPVQLAADARDDPPAPGEDGGGEAAPDDPPAVALPQPPVP